MISFAFCVPYCRERKNMLVFVMYLYIIIHLVFSITKQYVCVSVPAEQRIGLDCLFVPTTIHPCLVNEESESDITSIMMLMTNMMTFMIHPWLVNEESVSDITSIMMLMT